MHPSPALGNETRGEPLKLSLDFFTGLLYQERQEKLIAQDARSRR
jgi:hypothetical protein